jgi:NDP-sugar pyrophosphorylase family protein
MHIIIPMSGIGNRFIKAGYSVPKPLIEIGGIPIIEHVCNLFPGEEKFTFICNSQHLLETNMREILTRIKPLADIVEIPNHKLGPVYAVSQVFASIEDDDEVIVNYCDFGSHWDYQEFLKHTRNRNADGAIPSYRGFHPHMLGNTNYAFIRDQNQWMLEIKEKEPFTDNRQQEFASNGTYYFKKGLFVKRFFKELMDKNCHLKGEYYVSLVFNLLVNSGLNVSIYEVQHMLQWGTPEDVEEFNQWFKYFDDVVNFSRDYQLLENTHTLIPLAGKGSRFLSEGYLDPKPLIDISGKPMIIQAANSLPRSEFYEFVVLDEHLSRYPLKRTLLNEFPESNILALAKTTEGQSVTCEIGLKNVPLNHSLIISATDNGLLFNQKKLYQLINDSSVDAIIFTFRNHPSSKVNPQMYGWVVVEDDGITAKAVSVKVPISDNPAKDHAVVGTFWFKEAKLFHEAFQYQMNHNVRVNDEYYVDSLMGILVDLGYSVKVLEVEHYICWGTPNDYRTFVYWQSFFHKCNWHPYKIELDPSVDQEKVKDINKSFRLFKQAND